MLLNAKIKVSLLHRIFIILFLVFVSACSILGVNHYDKLFGKEQTRQRIVKLDSEKGQHFINQIKPIIDNRCVVCHGCYDAPCQLKLSSPAGIDRGVSKTLVYDGTRLLALEPSRLLFDAKNTQAWRRKGFNPVLNERDQTIDANLTGSVFYNSLLLKMKHPLPKDAVLGKEFDFALDRAQSCSSIDEFSTLAKNQPYAGMPYGLPALSGSEFSLLEAWIKEGAKMALDEQLPDNIQQRVHQWETFLNDDDKKHQLTARYIYEHWFLAHLYFPQVDTLTNRPTRFFKLVRSTTPPGESIKLVSTRRPYEDPAVKRVYYRLMLDTSTILSKTHLPLALADGKLARINQLFIEPDYHVNELPSYQAQVASNPFKAFEALPVKSRYQFMLDDAELIIMGFIKGPVCRGQIALNVINDHFWVVFADPDKTTSTEIEYFLQENKENLALPAAEESNALPVSNWLKYAERESEYLAAKEKLANELFKGGEQLTTDLLWHGEGENKNAALTIFRHNDSASVVKGLVGDSPKTTWILDYAAFERIHYLLVAGFDVYGNIGHQLVTRLYMDFLRLEGEKNFLALLPLEERGKLRDYWYRNAHPNLMEYLKGQQTQFTQPTGIQYKTQDPQAELYQLIKQSLSAVLSDQYQFKDTTALTELNKLPAAAVNLLPQVSFILVKQKNGSHKAYTLLHNNAHYNISSLLNESAQRAFKEDTATIAPGFIGDYPHAIWYLEAEQQRPFVTALAKIKSEQDYKLLKARFAVRRTDAKFWYYSDLIHKVAREYRGVEFGLFDYNRLENR